MRTSYEQLFIRTSLWMSVLIIAAGCAVIVGWAFDVTLLKGIAPGLATMKANTAVCFVLGGISLFLKVSNDERARRNSLIPALIVLAIALVTAAEYFFGLDFGIDQLLFADTDTLATAHPGRMAPITTLNFLLIAAALLLLDTRISSWLTQFLSLYTAFNSALALAGYLYGVSSLYRIAEFSSVALHTSISMLLLAAGTLFAQPQRGIMWTLSSRTAGGTVARRLLPVFLLLPGAMGWVRLYGQRSGLYDSNFGLALFVVATTVSFSALILWVSAAVSRTDSDRHRAEQALRISEEGYKLLFDSNPHPMWVYDLETLNFLAVNNAALLHYGYSLEEFLSMSIMKIRPAEDIPSVNEALNSLTSESITRVLRRHRKKDGTIIQVEGMSRAVMFGGRPARLVLALDISDRKRLEEQLVQSQKMEAIGRLAGGVAHDFNNLLTAIIGYSDLVMDRLTDDLKSRQLVNEIRQAGRSAAELTSQLLTFSRKQMVLPTVLNLNEIVSAVQRILARVIGEDITLTTICEDGLSSIKADRSQIEQIIMNLAVNARDAMPNGGRLTIETANVELDESYCESHPEVVPGRYVLLAVSDDGHGMDAATQSRIFEPFYTTKGQGKGTGLGLSTVYGIVKQSGGHIWLYSEPSHGATFKIYLPRVETGEIVATPEHQRETRSLDGSEMLLLVEDDDAVRRLTSIALERQGYRILAAEGCSAAIAAFAQNMDAIGLVITDIVMPDMSGPELVSTLRELNPSVKVLYVSGYTENDTIRKGMIEEGTAFLQKPFTPHSLAAKVREIIDRGSLNEPSAEPNHEFRKT